MIPDTINGSFELLGGILTFSNVYRLIKDKVVRRIDWKVTFFFQSWGLWNLYYYPHLEQWFSFSGGILITTANTIWLLLLIKYSAWRLY